MKTKSRAFILARGRGVVGRTHCRESGSVWWTIKKGELDTCSLLIENLPCRRHCVELGLQWHAKETWSLPSYCLDFGGGGDGGETKY